MAQNDSPQATSKSLRCVVVTPERAVLDEAVEFVALPMYDGELGVMPGRLPLIGRMGYGELRFVQNHQTHRYYIDGGFAQIRNNVVTILTSKAVAAEQISIPAAEQVLHSHAPVGSTAENQEALHRQQERARVQLRVAKKQGDHPGTSH